MTTIAEEVARIENEVSYHRQRADDAEVAAKEWMTQFAEASKRIKELEDEKGNA